MGSTTTISIAIAGASDSATTANAAVLQLDGTDDYVDIGDAAIAEPGFGDLTVETWFYWDGTAPVEAEFLVAKGNAGATNAGWAMSINPAGNLKIVVNNTGDNSDAGNAAGKISLGSLPVGWHHAAFVFDSDGTTGSLTGYLDGSSSGWANNAANDSDGMLTFGGVSVANSKSLTIGIKGISAGGMGNSLSSLGRAQAKSWPSRDDGIPDHFRQTNSGIKR